MCKYCKTNPVFINKINKIRYCAGCFMKYFEKKVRKTVRVNKLIKKGDKILVAASGGKDSTVLLYLLNKIYSKNKIAKIEAITVDPSIGKFTSENVKRLKIFCKKNKIKLFEKSFRKEFGYSLCYIRDLLKKKGYAYTSCAICGVLRRYIINKFARENKFNTVATGHNLDDEAESFLMNIFKNKMNITARLGPKTGILKTKVFIPRVKPLYFNTEEEVVIFSKLLKLNVVYEKCPCRAHVFREDVEKILDNVEKKHPGTKYAVVNSFLEVLPTLKEFYKKEALNVCEKCEEPTSGKVCKTCEIISKLYK